MMSPVAFRDIRESMIRGRICETHGKLDVHDRCDWIKGC